MSRSYSESTQVGYRIRGIEPPDLDTRYPEATHKLFWSWVVDLGLKRKDYELARGWNKDGAPMKRLAPGSIKYRKSEVGPTDKHAPPLEPAHALSRVRSLLTGRPHSNSAEFWWGFDSVSGESFARILRAQRERFGDSRDVFGLSERGVEWVRLQALRQWEQWKRAQHTGTPSRQPRLVGRQLPKYEIPKRMLKGRTDLGNMTAGAGSVPGETETAIAAGQHTGFRRLNLRGEKWTPGTGLGPARPGQEGPGTPGMSPRPRPRKPAPPSVSFPSAPQEEVSATAEKLLGRKASTQELLELAGAPHGSTVEMLAYSERVTVKVKSGHSYWTIQARKDLDGKLNLEMPEIEIQRAKQGTGIGRGVFRRIIHQAQSLDFHRITLLAARDDRRAKPMFGYKVWPKFGFDGEIPDRFLAMLPKELQAAKTISDLYVTPGGREWWEKNGGSVRLAFDLKGDSLSWVIWRAYLATKGEVP